MNLKKASGIIIVSVAIALMAPPSVQAGFRGHRGHYGHHSYYGHHGTYGHHGYYGYPGYYSSGYYGHPRATRFYDASGAPHRAIGRLENLGALDLNVKPKKTQVYLNGRYIGVAGKFDGFPNYLWLTGGNHELTFYNDGYVTVVNEFEILPGAIIDVTQRLSEGESVPPGGTSK